MPLPTLSRPLRYLGALLAAVLAVVVRAGLELWLGHDGPLMVFVLAVAAASSLGGLGPGLVATGACAIALALSVPPIGDIFVTGPHDSVRILLFLIVGVVVSMLAERRRWLEARAIRERERASEALERERVLRSEAEHLAHLRDEFLATVSHELRTPLSAVLGWTQLLLSAGERSPEASRKMLETIERNARAQSQIIDDLLDASRLASGKVQLQPTRTRLDQIARDAIETTRPAASARGIRLLADLSPASVEGDPQRLHQIAWNLLSNAVKFGRAGGTVWVRAGLEGGEAVLAVRDDGKGIAPEFLPHVFDKFRQEDPSATRHVGGLGLGLAITRTLVELHGGRVVAESPGPGEGSTFSVRLPSAAHVSERRAELAEPLRDLEGTAVLVVDDDPDSLELAAVTLERAGARVVRARSADEALAAVETGEIGVVVMDLMMPGTDGYTALREMRARGSTTPVIALTALAFPPDRERTRRAGFERHLAKPVESDVLVRAVAGSLHRSAG